jgi:hypothetical protein
MVHVNLTEGAQRQLHDRVRPDEVLLIQPGPLHEDYLGVAWTSDDDEVVPAARWLLLPVYLPSESIPAVLSDARVIETAGLRFLFTGRESDLGLRIDVVGDALWVYEQAA